MARTTAAWARNGCAFAECRAQALTAHFHQAELANRAKLHAGTVLAQGIAQTVFNVTAIAGLFHVDKVNDDQAAQIAQTHLTGYFVSRFQVSAGSCFFNITAFDGTCRVDIHRNQRFGVVNHNGAAGRQLHCAGISRLDLVLNLKA